MKVLHYILLPFKKFFKGMLALLTLNLLVILCVFIFDSCKKAAYERSDDRQANARFMEALETNKKSIAAVSFDNRSKSKSGTIALKAAPETNTEPVYVNFPNNVSIETVAVFENTNSIQKLANLLYTTDATIQYKQTPANLKYQINLPVETIKKNLNPLVQESKQYLYSKGFTERDIQQMIAEENAVETDLVPLVMIITQAESKQLIARNYLNLFPINSASAKVTWAEVGACAIEAVGADILFSFEQSTATVWTKAVIKKAFKTVAKRMLGPIGVGIAVVEFGWCLMRKYN